MLFKYKAVKNNKIVINQINAENQESVLRFLKSSDYFPVYVKRTDSPNSSLFASFLNRVSFNDIVDFTRQLAIMLNAGLTLIDSLDIMKKQINKPPLSAMIESLDKEIKGGSNFSTALSNYPQYFSGIYIALVKSGEASGKLSEILLKLSDNLENEREFKGKLKGALVYPAIVIVGMIIVGFIMITFVIPQLLTLYKDFNAELPLSTRIIMAISGFFSQFWIFIIIAVAAAVFGVKQFLSTEKGKLFFDKLLLKLPAIGNVIKMSVLVDSTRTLSILINSGVSILEGLTIIVDTSSNVVYKNSFINIKKQIEKGLSLGKALKEEELFPPILVQMTMVGEQTGHLDETLMRISRYFEMESELAIKAMTTLIEPSILVILGVGVAFLVFAIITPIYNLTSTIK